jgi:hypothetical protein
VTWRVLYWEGDQPVWREQGDWHALPVEGVLWVDLEHEGYRHCLSGSDYYWVHGLSFGQFNDPSNWDWYGHATRDQYRAWRWVEGGSERVEPATVPLGAHVIEGVLVPDEVAWDLGLLPRGEHLPPRPR